MSYWIHTKNPVGCFTEKDVGNYFEYSVNETGMFPDCPHIVWVGGVANDSGYRFANVKKTVAYIATDEDDNGLVFEKWNLKKNNEYVAQ